MFLRDAAQADFIVDVGNERWKVPLFTLGDFIDWGAEVDADRLKRATEGMDEKKRFEFVSFYDVPSVGLDELLRLIWTPAGCGRICAICLRKASIIRRDKVTLNPPETPTEQQVQGLLIANTSSLTHLAKILVAKEDPAELKDEPEEGGEVVDPLTSGEKVDSPSSLSTGQTTSPSSQPSIQEPTFVD